MGDQMESFLNPAEEMTLGIIKTRWDETHVKLSITEVQRQLANVDSSFSFEKVRQIIESLWRKGELLIDVQGRERMVRPNHVTINSKSEPTALRNFTVLDERGSPIQRIWVSFYNDENGKYLSISESRWNGSWKTTSNIIIPPMAMDEFKVLVQFMADKLA